MHHLRLAQVLLLEHVANNEFVSNDLARHNELLPLGIGMARVLAL